VSHIPGFNNLVKRQRDQCDREQTHRKISWRVQLATKCDHPFVATPDITFWGTLSEVHFLRYTFYGYLPGPGQRNEFYCMGSDLDALPRSWLIERVTSSVMIQPFNPFCKIFKRLKCESARGLAVILAQIIFIFFQFRKTRGSLWSKPVIKSQSM